MMRPVILQMQNVQNVARKTLKIIYLASLILFLTSCRDKNQESLNKSKTTTTMSDSIKFTSGYSDVNGIKMYYEIYGEGEPLVLIHGGGSTIQSTFGRIIPQLAKDHHLIA